MDKFFNSIWYSKFNLFSLLLLPLSLIYLIIITVRRYFYRVRIFQTTKFDVPVIIVGNISLGGSGKTPFCIWLIIYLLSKGLRVGVVSSGYKGSSEKPIIINENSDPRIVGDEAKLLFEKTNAKTVSCGNRVHATKLLLDTFNLDVVIHDDGMQHYSLNRDYEIILTDNDKLFGNGYLLPSGPLREVKSRIFEANISVLTNVINDKIYAINSINNGLENVVTKEIKSFDFFKNKQVNLVAGIASIKNITNMLDQHMINYVSHKFDDHHNFSGDEFNSFINEPIFLTSKDYVKLSNLNNSNIWVILHDIIPNNLLLEKINDDLSKLLKYEN